MASSVAASPKIVTSYVQLFVNRRAYTLQSSRPHPESGRHYYFRPKGKGAGQELGLTALTIRRHLEGEITIGLYAINPATQRSKWVAIDADYPDAMEDLLKLQYSLHQDKVEAALEMSRRGGHLWILMERPALARECRIYIYNLALKLGMRIKGIGLAEGIEIFPKHDALREGEFGNAIRGPLGIHRGANRRYRFYGADYDLEKQMAYLNRLRKLSEEQLRSSSPAGSRISSRSCRKRTAELCNWIPRSSRMFFDAFPSWPTTGCAVCGSFWIRIGWKCRRARRSTVRRRSLSKRSTGRRRST